MDEKIENAKSFLARELRNLKESQNFFDVDYVNRQVDSYEVLIDYIKDLEENSKALQVLANDMKEGRLLYISDIKKKIDSIFE